jgi:adenylate kinase family enzyme
VPVSVDQSFVVAELRRQDGLHRIAVVGTTGSGKTRLAGQLAGRLAVPHVELDAIHWGPDWSHAPADHFRTRVKQALQGPAWVVDGSYSEVRHIIWAKADMVVWLDYPLPLILWRVTWRTLLRTIRREELWSGNRERFLTAFTSRESIILYALRTYRRRRREYPAEFARPEHAHLRIVHLRSPDAARVWLEGLAPRGSLSGN